MTRQTNGWQARAIEVPIYDRKGNVRARALVDDIDAERVQAHRWTLLRSGRVMATLRDGQGNRRGLYMHRLVLDLGPFAVDGREIDHINRNPLDNRRENLRIVTHAQNAQNRPSYRNSSSRFRGVSWDKRLGRWRASVWLSSRRHNLGLYDDEIEAARAAARFRAEHMTHSVDDPELLGVDA